MPQYAAPIEPKRVADLFGALGERVCPQPPPSHEPAHTKRFVPELNLDELAVVGAALTLQLGIIGERMGYMARAGQLGNLNVARAEVNAAVDGLTQIIPHFSPKA